MSNIIFRSLIGFALSTACMGISHAQTLTATDTHDLSDGLKLGDRIDCVDSFERSNGSSVPGRRDLSDTIKRVIVDVVGTEGSPPTPTEREIAVLQAPDDRANYKYIARARSVADLVTQNDPLLEVVVFTAERTVTGEFFYGRNDFSKPLTVRVKVANVPGSPETVAYTVVCQATRN